MVISKNYKEVIVPLLEKKEFEKSTKFLLENSNLPGRMVNLKLISTVADTFGTNKEIIESWYPILEQWFNTKADGNNQETILVLTALESFGSIYNHVMEKDQLLIERYLINSLNDERWRVREIVTESYKRIGLESYDELIHLFKPITSNYPTPLEMRGILATVAHPELLTSKEQLDYSQKILELSFNYYLTFDGNKYSKEEKLALKKGLSFAPSVILGKNPNIGFSYFKKLIEENNQDIKTIIKENLKKKRLVNYYPDEVEQLLKMMSN